MMPDNFLSMATVFLMCN